MRISKPALGIFISMILLSLFLANVVNVLSINTPRDKNYTKKPFLKISDKPDHLIWFLQISDIHISIFRDPTRISEFEEFCHLTIDAIKPSVVLASGDLTDAKTKDAIGSQQYELEWKHYRDILNKHNVKNKTIWLDIRGNHDNFNVADIKSSQNFFTNYSIVGSEHPRSYMVQVRKNDVLYSIIGVDACLEPGPRRPFNFIGIVDTPEKILLNTLIKKTYETGSNYSIWFGHFPTSCILTSGFGTIRDLIEKDENSFVYVCGHLHHLGGIIKKMYTMQKEGFLELELGDWKENRVYRLLAIDHGMFSFTDIYHRQWPVVLITNPKHLLYVNSLKENLDNMKYSTHVRVLAFSLSAIETVKIRIDGAGWYDCKHIEGPLYVVEWEPINYSVGTHVIEAYVSDIDGRETTVSQPFALDNSRMSFDVLPRIALMSNVSAIFRAFFVMTLLTYLLPLCLLRFIYKLVINGKISRPKLRGNCLRSWLRKFFVLSTINRIFLPIILYPIYLVFGPWSIGYIVEDHIGVIFSWGIFVNGAYLPGSFTYAYGFIQLITFQIPLSFVMAHMVDLRVHQIVSKTGKKMQLKQKVCLHLPFCIVLFIQIVMAYLFWLAYGTLAFILGPLRTWSIVLAAVLYYAANNLPVQCTRRVAEFCYVTKSEIIIKQEEITLSEEVLEKSK